MLLAAALKGRHLFPRCVYILGGVVMVFFGGEEINWGQRIIGFETPAFLANLNTQGEFNLHNIREYDENFIESGRQWELLFALGVVDATAFFCRKDRIFGILAPPIILTLAFLVVMSSYFHKEVNDFSAQFLRIILTWHRWLLLLLLVFALFSRNAELSIAAAASLSLIIATAYVGYHIDYTRWSGPPLWYFELLEYLFSVISLFYALAALLDQGMTLRKMAAAALSYMFIPPPRQNRVNFRPNQGGLSNALDSGLRAHYYGQHWDSVHSALRRQSRSRRIQRDLCVDSVRQANCALRL